MIRLNMFFATEARANFFKVLKMVGQGDDVIVINKESGQKFKISLLKDDPKSGKQAILKQIADTDLKSKSPEEIKRIIENRLSEDE